MDFIVKFITAVVAGPNDDDLVVFGPPMVVNDGQKVSLEAWVPKDKKARKGSEVLGAPTIRVKEGTEIVKSYTKDGVEVPLSTWKLRVVVSGDYQFQFRETQTVSLQEFFKNA